MDVCQDVFVTLLKQRGSLKVEYPSSLVYRIATNLCLNRIRNRGRAGQPTDDAILASVACADDPAEKSLSTLVLDRIFGRHPESTRTMAVLHHVEGFTLEEVATEVGMSVSGVRKRLRALKLDVASRTTT